MITREFLLNNGFEFRVWDGSKSPNGEYTKRVGGIKIIRIGYSDLFDWDFEILNADERVEFKARQQQIISIDYLQKLLDLAKIDFKLK